MVEKLKMNYQGIHFLKSKEKYIISNKSNDKYNKLELLCKTCTIQRKVEEI